MSNGIWPKTEEWSLASVLPVLPGLGVTHELGIEQRSEQHEMAFPSSAGNKNIEWREIQSAENGPLEAGAAPGPTKITVRGHAVTLIMIASTSH